MRIDTMKKPLHYSERHVVRNGNTTDRRMLSDWIAYWGAQYGIALSINTLRVRRRLSGIGLSIPPHTYLLTHDEVIDVLETPLPGCNEGARIVRDE